MRDEAKKIGVPAVAAAAVAALLAGASPSWAVGGVQAVAGHWDLSLNDTNRKCRMTLRSDPQAAAYALAMPAGCRRAMPILASVGGWTVAPNTLALIDGSGALVLQFAPKDDPANLVATGPEGETYVLAAAESGPRLEAEAPPGTPAALVAQAAPPPGAATPPPAAPPAVAALINPADLPGRYNIFRTGQKDTGCMLTLDDRAKGPKGGRKAMLAPACRDQGMVIFDPAGWKLDRNRLVLIAKKGHSINLDAQADGSWLKDPKEGAPVILKKM